MPSPALKRYLPKLNPSCKAFFQRPRPAGQPTKIPFVRATAISLWSDADIPDRHITFVSGHSNEQSLAHYSSLPSGPQLRKFSDTISNALGNGSSSRAESSSTTTVISPSKTSAPSARSHMHDNFKQHDCEQFSFDERVSF
ncbi:hypothetical protein OS493_031403 [Desmophyllum pertusum]|uniref:Uncharacterized protein n=1 Tax=Desmophyllum pertusum TaxID=174260 RepID=A0A9W9Y8H8_9CNID|nr:hypothetical protein OS493_031403 [Desmophyllum pertusum]